jgi:hypothetical protein
VDQWNVQCNLLRGYIPTWYAMVGLLRRKSEAVAVIGVILQQIQEVETLHSD